MRRWTVIALHNEINNKLLIAAVVPGHHHDESSRVHTGEHLYRFLSFVEAPTADAAEAMVLREFEAALAEMAAEAEALV